MKKDFFELGDWVYGEKGIGQLIFIRELYVEPFVNLSSYEKIDDRGVYRKLYGVKHLCDFDGKLMKKHKLIFSAPISHLDKKGNKILVKIKEQNSIDYHNYIIYDDLDEVNYTLSLEYFIDDKCQVDFEKVVYSVCRSLSPHFTFDEFKKEFDKYETGIDLKKFNRHGAYAHLANPDEVVGKKSITMAFYSINSKVINKKRIFSEVRIN